MCAGLVRRDRRLSGDCTVRQDIQSAVFAYRYVYLPAFSQGLLIRGPLCAFPIRKGYYGKSAHNKGVSSLLHDF